MERYLITRSPCIGERPLLVCQNGHWYDTRCGIKRTRMVPLYYYAWKDAPSYMVALVCLLDDTLSIELDNRYI